MSSSLEERLKNNSSAFDGLLSLIPAKYYYDEDTQEQWKAKKQSKDEAKQVKRAKLDPSQSADNEKSASASQVLKKRAKNAKPVVLPGVKKLPQQEDGEDSSEGLEGKEATKSTASNSEEEDDDDDDSGDDDVNLIFDDEGNEINLDSKASSPQEIEEETSKPKATIQSPAPETASTATSTEPSLKDKKKSKELTEEERKKKEESIKELREKLASKIDLLKQKRKALGSKAPGAPSSREAILEERRKKAEQKAEQKAERKRKLAEMQQNGDDEDNEEEDDDDSDASDSDDNGDGIIYQNIVFDENTKATSDLQNLRVNKKKGPAKKDLKAHLKLIESKKQKLNQLDDEKKQDLAEKEKWNRTLAQAEGQKLRDDEKLLKKALKRKEAQKRRSEVQWKERKEVVENTISARQKRREENLQIRKDNKGVKRKNQQKQKRKFKGTIAPKRPGFEGRRRSGVKK